MSEEAKPYEGMAISENAISDAISRIMEHPELISMVASALGGKSDGENKKSNDNDSSLPVMAEAASDSGSAPTVAAIAPMLEKLRSLGSSDKRGASGRHEQLLCALKPYLCDSRRDAVDFILKISQLSGLMGLLK